MNRSKSGGRQGKLRLRVGTLGLKYDLGACEERLVWESLLLPSLPLFLSDTLFLFPQVICNDCIYCFRMGDTPLIFSWTMKLWESRWGITESWYTVQRPLKWRWKSIRAQNILPSASGKGMNKIWTNFDVLNIRLEAMKHYISKEGY